jgi:predicted acyltransferase
LDKSSEATLSQSEDASPKSLQTKKRGAFDSLKEAWHLMDGIKWPVYKRLLIYVLLLLLMSPFIIIGVVWSMKLSPDGQILVRLIIQTLVQFPFFIIIIQMIMLGVRQALGLPLYLEK